VCSSDLLVRDGRAFFAAGEVARARDSFAAALALTPDDPAAQTGLEHCDRLLSAPSGGDDEFGPPEATVVDPRYALELQRELSAEGAGDGDDSEDGGGAGPGGDGPDTPRPPDGEAAGDGEGASAPGPPAGAEPSYPRFVASSHYPEVLPGGRTARGAGAAPSGPGAPPAGGALPSGAFRVDYPQMPSGARSGYPHYATPVGPGGPAVAPPPQQQGFLPGSRRGMIIIASVGAVCLGIGVLLGWAMAGGGGGASGGG